ncbi:MAG: hypothetical protein WA717_03040 [Methyloceanibacter sp.]|jgi:hypothetical protein
MPSRRSQRLGIAALGFIIGVPLAAYGVKAARDWQTDQRLASREDEIIALMQILPRSDFHQTVDRVRTFINDHSQDKVDAAFRAMIGDGVAFADGVIAHARDPSAERVHMECSTRANLTGRVLRRLGYETRTIALFRTKGRFASHSFLDVLDPHTKRWETLDADYDLYWKSLATGKRVSLTEAAGNLDEIMPCGRAGCGWDVRSHDGNTPKSLIQLLDILSVTSKENDVRYSVYTPRAKLDQVFAIEGENGTYCEVMAKRCRDGFRPIGAPHVGP